MDFKQSNVITGARVDKSNMLDSVGKILPSGPNELLLLMLKHEVFIIRAFSGLPPP